MTKRTFFLLLQVARPFYVQVLGSFRPPGPWTEGCGLMEPRGEGSPQGLGSIGCSLRGRHLANLCLPLPWMGIGSRKVPEDFGSWHGQRPESQSPDRPEAL